MFARVALRASRLSVATPRSQIVSQTKSFCNVAAARSVQSNSVAAKDLRALVLALQRQRVDQVRVQRLLQQPRHQQQLQAREWIEETMQLGRNSRKPKKANKGARPCSSVGRKERAKKKGRSAIKGL